jgi:hypothetical protein
MQQPGNVASLSFPQNLSGPLEMVAQQARRAIRVSLEQRHLGQRANRRVTQGIDSVELVGPLVDLSHLPPAPQLTDVGQKGISRRVEDSGSGRVNPVGKPGPSAAVQPVQRLGQGSGVGEVDW